MDAIKKVEMKEKKFKSVSDKRENFSKPNCAAEISSEVECPSCKIRGTILEMDEGRKSINEPKDEKDNNDASGLPSKEYVDRLYVARKENWRECRYINTKTRRQHEKEQRKTNYRDQKQQS